MRCSQSWCVAFTPKGGCPLKQFCTHDRVGMLLRVAFTPKGGCPLKPHRSVQKRTALFSVAFTPKGGCPLKRSEYVRINLRLRNGT